MDAYIRASDPDTQKALTKMMKMLAYLFKFKMHLLLWILALATIHTLPDITPHEGAMFQGQGYLIGGLSWAHITAPI